jgi:FkbM family methyltransferase
MFRAPKAAGFMDFARYGWQSAGHRIWKASQPSYRLRKDLNITIPGATREAARLILDWNRDWKTKIISVVLNRSPGAFLDIGVNNGHTLLDFCAAHVARKYIGFEPNPACVDFVNSIIQANHLENCMVFPVALSDANAVQMLYLSQGSPTDSGATIVPGLRPHKTTMQRPIACYRLDDIFGDLDIAEISLMKIDAEGAEFGILCGATNVLAQLRPVIICEVLDRDPDADAADYGKTVDSLMQLLGKHDYKVFRIRKSPDSRDISGLDQTDHFPEIEWTRERSDDCDYLFLPVEVDNALITA